MRWGDGSGLAVYQDTWNGQQCSLMLGRYSKSKGRFRDEMVRQGILASSRHPAKGLRRISLFKVDSGGKRRLLHYCHRSDVN